MSRRFSPSSLLGLFLSVAIAWLAVTSLPVRAEGPVTDAFIKKLEKNPEYQLHALSGISKPVSAPQACRDLSTTRWVSVIVPPHIGQTAAPLLLQSKILLLTPTLVGVVEFRI